MTSSTKFKAAVDTNIFISASLFGGNPEKIIKLIKTQQINLIISPTIELEIFRKLAQLNAPVEEIQKLKRLFADSALPVVPKKKVELCRDPKDNMFLEAALEAKADFLITGDKDLLTLKTFKSTKILTPKEFLGWSPGWR